MMSSRFGNHTTITIASEYTLLIMILNLVSTNVLELPLPAGSSMKN